jgi:uncharacterized heparinase superfamily protein
VDDTNSAALVPDGGTKSGAQQVRSARLDAEGATWLELAHDGYQRVFGLEHRRRLHLGASGEELRGEDLVVGEKPRQFAVRFHLHPDVQASLAQNRQGALVRLNGGAGYRMRVVGGEVSLDDSVYLGRRGQIRKTQQIVVTVAEPTGADSVKWIIARETR